MKNKKGFTLVELLAVIAILAILMVLALPKVLDMFNSAKKGSFVTQAQSLFKSAESAYMAAQLGSSSGAGTYCVDLNGSESTYSSLSMNGSESFKYYIVVNTVGEITSFKVYSESYKFLKNSATDVANINDSTVDDYTKAEYDALTCATMLADEAETVE